MTETHNAMRLPRGTVVAGASGLSGCAMIPALIAEGYRAADPELLILGVASLVLGALLGLLVSRRDRLMRIAFALLVYWNLDYYLFESAILPVIIAILLYAGLQTRWAATLAIQVAVFSFVFIVGTLFSTPANILSPALSAEGTLPNARSLPPIVHLMLDEQVPPELLGQFEAPPHVGQELEQGYIRRGFVLYPRTRAISTWSNDSVTGLLKLDPSDHYKLNARDLGGDRYAVVDNAYRHRLQAMGYRIVTIQSEYLDLCDQQSSDCHRYHTGNHGHVMRGIAPLGFDRLLLPLIELDGEARAYWRRNSVSFYLLATAFRPLRSSRPVISRPVTMLELSKSIAKFVHDEDMGGTVLFAHLLFPHFPWVLDENCQLLPHTKWRMSSWNDPGNDPQDADGAMADAYWRQAACAHKTAISIADAILSTPSGADTRIIIHGDHGARLFSSPGRATQAELASDEPAPSSLDTHFAVRAPGLTPGVDDTYQTLPLRFREIAVNHILSLKSLDSHNGAMNDPNRQQ